MTDRKNSGNVTFRSAKVTLKRSSRGAKRDDSHLFTLGLNKYQQKLNSRQLSDLKSRYTAWRAERQRETQSRLKSLPRRWRGKSELYQAVTGDRRGPDTANVRHLCDFFAQAVPDVVRQLDGMKRRHAEFRQAYTLAPTETEQRRLILKYAADLGATGRQLRGDQRAFQRWFAEDAVSDRYARRRGETEQTLEFYLDRFGQIATRVLGGYKDRDEMAAAWKRLDIDPLARLGLQYDGDVRVQRAALRCLVTALAGGCARHSRTGQSLNSAPSPLESDSGQFGFGNEQAPAAQSAPFLDRDLLNTIEKLARDRAADVWLQCEALEALCIASPRVGTQCLHSRIKEPGTGDDLFVRRRAVRILARHLNNGEEFCNLLIDLSHDTSAFVRQELALAIWHAPRKPAQYWLRHLACQDEVPRVRASVLVAALDHLHRTELHIPFLKNLEDILRNDNDAFVKRVSLFVAARWLEKFQETDDLRRDTSTPRVTDFYRSNIRPAIRQLQTSHESVAVRRQAAMTAERLFVLTNPVGRSLLKRLSTVLRGIRPGKSWRFSRRLIPERDANALGRVAAVIAQDDFGYDIQPKWYGYRVTRGPVFGLRAWRLLHELRTSATDKRQAFRHTIGRLSVGTIRAPSAILAELSETKVPGEPLLQPTEDSWRPYLPLVDDFVSATSIGLVWPRTIRFFTSDGVTELKAPFGPHRRLMAWLRLSWGFSRYARMRNWQDRDQSSASTYLDAMNQMGFHVRFHQHSESAEPKSYSAADISDNTVLRFFPCLVLAAAPPLIEAANRLFMNFASYFTSVFENSILHLLGTVIAVSGLFLGKHFYSNWTLRRSRNRIPLSLGGWGTRGKSGTERLKAALLSGMGYGIVSKTTGCEAMFLQGDAYGGVRELPLFRPYDKATIWEHRDVIRMAAAMSSSVFLWECMGLTPSYVDVLQRQWTQDDLATITNTYPDHEDLQGPAGWNVATVIAGFTPRRSHLITTEQQMLPIVRHGAERVQTGVTAVGWLQSGLLTDDVLDRFPYKEHPDNIALVLAMAEKLGCDLDFALKAMADEMVPDLGVLKTYPIANVRGRHLEFTNGMSANERFGCMGNWQRMGFADQDPVDEPHVWITTLINNRADRVPRSRVFASIMVNDIAVDRHFLIGGNLKGLQGFLSECWEEFSSKFVLWRGGDGSDDALVNYDKMARRFRQTIQQTQIRGALESMLHALAEQMPKDASPLPHAKLCQLWNSPEDLQRELTQLHISQEIVAATVGQVQRMQQSHHEYLSLREKVKNATVNERAAIEEEFRERLETWFQRKLVVIDNYDATGEQIIQRICEETPPGFVNRMMGMQNIKGTGLDFVYRWQAWQACFDACEMMTHENPVTARTGLQALSAIQDFGALCEQRVRATIAQVQETALAHSEQVLAELQAILFRLEETMQRILANRNIAVKQSRLADRVLSAVEGILDINDAVRRRNTADRIYRDLMSERISRDRAIMELRKINKRQKGGWLTARLTRAKPIQKQQTGQIHDALSSGVTVESTRSVGSTEMAETS